MNNKKIKFVREYHFANETCYDVIYYSGKCFFYCGNNIPHTVREFLNCAQCVKQYDPVLKREEIIYTSI